MNPNLEVRIVLLIFLSIFQEFVEARKFPDQWISQKLDHFNNSEKWRMRYFVNDEFYQNGGPMFIQIGGAYKLRSQLLESEYFHDLAKMNKALMFAVEHRFYGKSKPTSDLSNRNLKYLTIDQTLADIAHFITKMKDDYGLRDAKVILFGPSYAGSLVVWMKHRYPELVTGGWASSAPLLAKLEYPEYYRQIGKALRDFGGQQCHRKINTGLYFLRSYVNSSFGAVLINLSLGLCPGFNFKYASDVWRLFVEVADLYAMAIQYDDISTVCDPILNATIASRAVARWIHNKSNFNKNGCLNISYRKENKAMSNVTNFNGRRQLFYQKCNELGWFHTSTASGTEDELFPFELRLDLYLNLCSEAFGFQYTKEFVEARINETNRKFGGLNPSGVENIFLTQGEYDPWKFVGMQDSKHVSVIPGVGGTEDVFTATADDPQPIRDVQQKLADFIGNLCRKKNDSQI